MKKHLLLLSFLFGTFIAQSQSYCPPNGGTTNPAGPANPQQPSYLNNFDWTTTSPYYSINSQCMPNAQTSNPFESSQAELLDLSIAKDMKPADGWEMIAYNLGYDNNNAALAVRPEHTYIMLYNKYTGIVRILVKWCRISDYNGALITLKFATPGYQTNILDMASSEKALNAPHVPNPSVSTAVKFFNDNNSWGYADFKLNYDPCNCSFSENARLYIYSELINNSSIALTGKLTGTIVTDLTAGQGSLNSSGNFWKTANSLSDKMMTVHKGVQGFLDNYQKIYKDLADFGVTINAINDLGAALNDIDFLNDGLDALPYVSKGLKFVSAFLGGGSSASQISLAPLSVNLDVNIVGSMYTASPMHSATIGLPGSIHSNLFAGTVGGQPLYNETLGVFALMNTPVMYYKDSLTRTSFLNREKTSGVTPEYWELTNDYDFKQRNYKMSAEQLKYVINPASGLTLQDAEFMVIAEYEKPALRYNAEYPSPKTFFTTDELNKDNGLPIIGTSTGPSVDLANYIFQNAFEPIGSNNFKNDYAFSFLNDIIPVTGKKRRLVYNANATFDKWRCYVGNTTSPSSCGWQINNAKPFSYVQTNATLPIASWSYPTLNPNSHFKTTSSISTSMPLLVTPRPEFLTPRIKGFKLKMILNLKRLDNPNAQNVLYVVSYPIELREAPTGYNMAGSNYITDAQIYSNHTPVTPTNIFVQATQAEIASLCTSTTYRTASRMVTQSYKMAAKEDTTGMLKPIVYPNPASELITIATNNCEIINIVDISGRNVLNINSKKDTTSLKENEVSIDISALKTGVYFLRYKDSNGADSSIKFLVR